MWLAGSLAGAALLLTLLLLPITTRGRLGNGAVFFLLSPAEALAVFGWGAALAQTHRGGRRLGLLLFALGCGVGMATMGSAMATLAQWRGGFAAIAFVGPVACLAAGLRLVPAGSSPIALDAGVGALLGLAAGFSVALNDPTFGSPLYLAGAVATLCWLLFAPAVAVRRARADHIRIARRIYASWLFAIAILLGAAAAGLFPSGG